MDVSFDSRWERLPHLFAGELPADEAQALQQWIDAAPERREAVARLREVWELTGTAPRAWNDEAGLAAVQRRTSGEPGRVIAQVGQPTGRLPRLAELQRLGRGWRASAIAAAAALAVVAGGAVLWQARLQPSTAVQPPISFTTFTTRPGERLSLRLRDGTLVTLAPSTTLRQPSTYGWSDRTLFLDDGEAFFTATHDAARPFAVYTPRAIVRDLGTRFVVRAYNTDPVTDVVVAQGAVVVGHASRGGTSSAPLDGDSVILTRGQRARVTPNGGFEFTRAVTLEPYVGWAEGRLAFSDTPLAEAARRLSRWHGVEIRLADAATANRRLTASFGDEPIADVIHRVAASLDLDVGWTGVAYTLRARR